jgi:peptidyl-prolyl cis-trans isomerase D
MLGSFRKFSGSIYAKILLGIIIIPFIFWGMGSSITGGSKNVVVVIDKEKYSIQHFSNFIKKTALKKVEANDVEGFLFAFISEKLIEKEIEHFGIKLSDNSLSKLIRHQEQFKRENKFSRTEYEKFLIKNNVTAINFESILSKEEKKKQLLDFVGGGASPSKFLVNISYDKINQKRVIELINLNDVFKIQLNFSEDQIKTYFENNKNKYNKIYKSVKLLELSPKKLVDNNEFNDLFFKKIDEIDDLIFGGEKLNYIIQKFNLEKPNSFTINELGKDINSKMNKKITKDLIEEIFNIKEIEPTVLIEDKNKYFIVELVKTEGIQKGIGDDFIKKEILLDLGKKTKRRLITEIIDKINKNNFNKYDFDKLSKDKNVNIKKISLNNQNDDKILKKEIVNQIYTFPEKKVIIVNDIGLSENFLIYIDKIKNVTIDENSEEYQKYFNLSKNQIVSELYNTYENYIQKKYKIDINYQALDAIKNSYN